MVGVGALFGLLAGLLSIAQNHVDDALQEQVAAAGDAEEAERVEEGVAVGSVGEGLIRRAEEIDEARAELERFRAGKEN